MIQLEKTAGYVKQAMSVLDSQLEHTRSADVTSSEISMILMAKMHRSHCHGGTSTSRWPVAHFAGLAEISLRVR